MYENYGKNKSEFYEIIRILRRINRITNVKYIISHKGKEIYNGGKNSDTFKAYS